MISADDDVDRLVVRLISELQKARAEYAARVAQAKAHFDREAAALRTRYDERAAAIRRELTKSGTDAIH